jgi:hypothetical protein
MEHTGINVGNAWATANGLVDVRRPGPAADVQALTDRFAIIELIQTYGWSVDERRMGIRTLTERDLRRSVRGERRV